MKNMLLILVSSFVLLGCVEQTIYPPVGSVVEYMKPGVTELSEQAKQDIDSLVIDLSRDMGNTMMVFFIANDTNEVRNPNRDNAWYLTERHKNFHEAVRSAVDKLSPDLKAKWQFVRSEQRHFSGPQDISVIAIFKVNPADVAKIDWDRKLVWKAIKEKKQVPEWAQKQES